MALDWNKEISFSSLLGSLRRGKGATGTGQYPTKTSMNLYQGDETSVDVRKVAIAGILIAIFIGVFVKFGVLDQLAILSQKQAELSQQQALASEMQSATADYESVKATYDAYMARYGRGSNDAIAVLDMVEQHVMSAATVTSIVFSDNSLTLTLYDVSLVTVGDIAKELEGQDMVSAVNVSTATTQNAGNQNTVSTIVVRLKSPQA